MGEPAAPDREQLAARREQLRRRYLRPAGERTPSAARGVHHVALISSEVERTVCFYQDVLGFPLTDMFENRDLPGSTHFFFDLGHGNALAFFDLPGVDPGPYAEVLGGLHHLALSVTPESWQAAVARLQEAGVPLSFESGTSVYFRDPDGARLELIADELGSMYGAQVV